jgi:hypothetical protein
MLTNKLSPKLWPYGALAAVIGIPLILLALGLLSLVARTYLGWPVDTSDRLVLLVFVILSVSPLGLVLIDFIASKGAVVGNDWIKIDFSKAVVETGSARRETSGLPDNILSAAESITDSGGMKMVAEMRRATSAEIICIDLKEGNAWWETRLLVLCAGAAGPGSSLRAVVFVGKRNNNERQFLGWAAPLQLLVALKDSNPGYSACFTKATMIARQLSIFGGGASPLLPPAPLLHPTVSAHQWSYDEEESVMLAKILLQELQSPSSDLVGVPGTVSALGNLEEPPPRLTTGRLRDLFESFLYTDTVDRSKANDEQLAQFLASNAPYVAIVREGRYEGMLRSELGQRAILRDLVARDSDRG